jgi:hypothetical protein
MKYKTAAAFRSALEARLLNQSPVAVDIERPLIAY